MTLQDSNNSELIAIDICYREAIILLHEISAFNQTHFSHPDNDLELKFVTFRLLLRSLQTELTDQVFG